MTKFNTIYVIRSEIYWLAILLIITNLVAIKLDQFLICNLIAAYIYLFWHLVSLILFVSWQNSESSNPSFKPLGIWSYFVQHELSLRYKIKKNQIKYRNSLNQLEVTTKALPDATILIDSKGRIQWSNDSALSLLNISERDIGHFITQLVPNQDFQNFIENPQASSLEFNLSNVNNITLSIRLIEYNKSQKLLIARDISQQLQLQQTRRAFVANASHELRTPLTVISGYLEILQSQDEVYQQNKMPIDNAVQQAARMNLIIDDLLELSKIEHSKIMHSDKDEVNFAKLLSKLLNDLEPLILKKKFEIKANFDSDLKILANKNQMQSLAENLIKNALIHNPLGTKLELFWQLDSAGNPVLTVCDYGCGIPANHLEHITERFYRVENDNSIMAQGTGLGMAIVKHIIAFHDAELFMDSKLGTGTKFLVTFPKNRLV